MIGPCFFLRLFFFFAIVFMYFILFLFWSWKLKMKKGKWQRDVISAFEPCWYCSFDIKRCSFVAFFVLRFLCVWYFSFYRNVLLDRRIACLQASETSYKIYDLATSQKNKKIFRHYLKQKYDFKKLHII